MKGHTLALLIVALFACMEMLAQNNSRIDSLRQAIRNRARRESVNVNDTLPARFPISDINPTTIDDLDHHPLDLRNPQNIVTDTIYNDKDSMYSIVTRLGDRTILGAPIQLHPEEYSRWTGNKSMQTGQAVQVDTLVKF